MGIGTTYYYRVIAEFDSVTTKHSAIESVAVPARDLGTRLITGLHIDKVSYVLEALAGNSVLKRYPIALGRNPVSRKLCRDKATTPEGAYQITGMRPRTSFHRALDLSYPHLVDRVRYDRARRLGTLGKVPSRIGGDIQIHGGGIGWNWTWGCIALRNEDIDELFAAKGVNVGTPVTISGREAPRKSSASSRNSKE